MIFNPSRLVIWVLVVVLSGQCISKPEEIISPTTGKIHILADKSLQAIVEQEKEVFESYYKYASLIIQYDSEYNILNEFFKDSVDVIFISRALTVEEMNFFRQKNIFPNQVHFASGALAFIVSNQTRDTTYTYEQFNSLLTDSSQGKWFVIENNQSGIAAQVLKSVNLEKLPSHFFAKPSKEEVIAYIEQYPDAIGIVDYSEISDSDASYSREVMNKIQLLALSRPKDSLQKGFVKPYQYNLQDKIYPFTRELYYIGIQIIFVFIYSSFKATHGISKIVIQHVSLSKFRPDGYRLRIHIPGFD